MDKQKISITIDRIIFLLVLLWIYTATSKLIDIDEFKRQLANQVFGKRFTHLLVWLLPSIEIIAVLLLAFKRTKLAGLFLSSLLMLFFTGYIALVLLHYFPRIPCSCGGVLKKLSWSAHLWFNIFFLLLSMFGTYLQLNNQNNKDTSCK